MKKTVYTLITFATVIAIASCNTSTEETKKEQNTSTSFTDTVNKEIWAEQMVSNNLLKRMEGADDEYWNDINKNVNRANIFNTIIDAVISGKQKAFNFENDTLFTLESVKERLINHDFDLDPSKKNQHYTSDDLSALRFSEKWIFDKVNFKLENKVSRIDVIVKKFSADGKWIGERALFYVKLNN